MRRLMVGLIIVVLSIATATTIVRADHSQQRQDVRTTSLQQATPAVVTTSSTTTTVAPTTTLPPVIHKKAVRAPVRAEPASGDVFDRLAMCESGMHNDTSGPFYGFFQFLPSTWRSMGFNDMPYDHDYATQKDAAQRLVARSGFGQFPACSRKLGLR